MKKIAIIGVGNILFKDEGIGVFIVKYLQENYIFKPTIDLIDAGTLGFRLMEYLEDYDYIILVDTISIKDKPGSVFRLTAEDLAGIGSYHQTAHEVEVLQMLELTALKGKRAETIIIGIVPENICTSEIGLTKPLENEGFKTATYQVLKELEKLGIKYEKVNNLSLKDTVIKHFGSYNGELIKQRIGNEDYRDS
ncbi:HyaD/HybD family hydrogenase maturation endopeptidase [Hydrogenivirga sp. 128-5-R1-1]|uniref:HyaD/HybD family hydrogenase maturation endopeptidase n=1 Tax=Hydrogenivirga sp. 128-5-R1-1 TaxID=392423 RepID=UPI00015EFD8F|nr:HyaD/HybD family hydrogenase maturation endopeptidase [Hydrogenivirga sp. 128-5-R1-1]EDP73106.1 Peptidase M52, hydrogen uptake protein [Hydrogenivirga sp. 128-5-R1-1]